MLCSCLWCLWFSFDNRLLRLLWLHWGWFYWLGLDVDVLRLARGTCLCLALLQALFLDLQLQPRTLFPLLLLPLMSALYLSGLVLLRLLLKQIQKNDISWLFSFFYNSNSSAVEKKIKRKQRCTKWNKSIWMLFGQMSFFCASYIHHHLLYARYAETCGPLTDSNNNDFLNRLIIEVILKRKNTQKCCLE